MGHVKSDSLDPYCCCAKLSLQPKTTCVVWVPYPGQSCAGGQTSRRTTTGPSGFNIHVFDACLNQPRSGVMLSGLFQPASLQLAVMAPAHLPLRDILFSPQCLQQCPQQHGPCAAGIPLPADCAAQRHSPPPYHGSQGCLHVGRDCMAGTGGEPERRELNGGLPGAYALQGRSAFQDAMRRRVVGRICFQGCWRGRGDILLARSWCWICHVAIATCQSELNLGISSNTSTE